MTLPRSEFDRQLAVVSSPQQAWAMLIDVPRLADWIGIVENVHEIEPLARYEAVLRDRLGPFKLRADLDVVVSDVQVERRIMVRASGEDRQVGSRLAVEATMMLQPGDPDGTSIQIAGAYEVTGRVASMGSGTINKKVEKILDEFFSQAGAALGAR